MDDLLVFIIALFCGDGQAKVPDPVLLALFQGAGQTTITCIDPDERTAADYPRLLISGEEGDQSQSGDAQARTFAGTVRLEIVTRATAATPDELDLLDNIKARVTDLLLGSLDGTLLPDDKLPPMQGRKIVQGSKAYNVSVFSQVRPTGRLPSEDPTIKRWGATYRVQLLRLLV